MSVKDNLKHVLNTVRQAEKQADRVSGTVRLVAVSKTHDGDAIRPAIEAGQRVFGENRVQEAQTKWPSLKQDHPDIELHLIGPLQSNKTAEAVALFDVIQSVDREKIARAIAKEMKTQAKTVKLYVQVNTGDEPQKAGISPSETSAFIEFCHNELGLVIEGLMCIPPADENPGPHFMLLDKLARAAGIEQLSMGMSGDYETAISFGATDVRVGSAIFGQRDYQV